MSDNYYYYINAVGEQAASPLTAVAIVALVKSKVCIFKHCVNIS